MAIQKLKGFKFKTKENYQALTDDQKNDGSIYFVEGEGSGNTVTEDKVAVTDIRNITASGFYRGDNDTLNQPDTNKGLFTILAQFENESDTSGYFLITYISGSYNGRIYTQVFGNTTYGDWDWLNEPTAVTIDEETIVLSNAGLEARGLTDADGNTYYLEDLLEGMTVYVPAQTVSITVDGHGVGHDNYTGSGSFTYTNSDGVEVTSPVNIYDVIVVKRNTEVSLNYTYGLGSQYITSDDYIINDRDVDNTGLGDLRQKYFIADKSGTILLARTTSGPLMASEEEQEVMVNELDEG